jgi:hypothetical protein
VVCMPGGARRRRRARLRPGGEDLAKRPIKTRALGNWHRRRSPSCRHGRTSERDHAEWTGNGSRDLSGAVLRKLPVPEFQCRQ